MSLLIAPGGLVRRRVTADQPGTTDEVIPQAGLGASYPYVVLPTDVAVLPEKYPLSFWCWGYQYDQSEFTPAYLADPSLQGLNIFFSGGAWTYMAQVIDNWYNPAAVHRLNAPGGAWQGWGANWWSQTGRELISPYPGVKIWSGDATHWPTLTPDRFIFAACGPPNSAFAEITVWNATLTDQDVVDLRAGKNPSTLYPDKLLIYLPLRNDVKDHGPNNFPIAGVGGWTEESAVFWDHPPVEEAVTGPPEVDSPAIGTATGTATVAGVGAFTAPIYNDGVGSATGTATVSGVGDSSSTITSVGTVAGTSTADAVSSSINIQSGTGTAEGTSVVSGFSAALAPSIGTVTGTSTASGISESIAEVTSVGSASGVSTVSGVGVAADLTSIGTATGSSTASGVTAVSTAGNGVGTSAGLATVNGVASARSISTATSVGSSTAFGFTGAVTGIDSTGTATGASTANAIAQVTSVAVGSAPGSSAMLGVGASQTGASAIGSIAGTSTVDAVAQAFGLTTGTVTGTSTADGVGYVVTAGNSVGTAAGSSIAHAVGKSNFDSVATAVGISTSTGISSSVAINAGVGTAAGSSTSQAYARALLKSIGTATGTSIAYATGTQIIGAGATGSSEGTSSANAFGIVTTNSVGTATGTSTARATSQVGNVGKAVGKSTAKGVSSFLAVRSSIGTAQGTSSAIGIPPAIAARKFHKQLYDFLEPIMSGMSPPLQLIYSRQNAPKGNKPFAVIDVTSITLVQHENYSEPTDTGMQRLSSMRMANVSLQVFGHGAGDTVRWIAQSMMTETSIQRMQRLDVSVGRRNLLTEIPSLLNGSQYEERGIYQFVFYFTEDMDDNVGLIQAVDIEGDLETGASGDLNMHCFIDARPPNFLPGA